MTLYQEIFAKNAKRFAGAPFLDDARIGAFNIGESLSLSCECAQRLYDLGLRPGDALVLKATRNAATAILFNATQILGLIVIPMDERENAEPVYNIDPRVKAIAYQKDEAHAIASWTVSFHGDEKPMDVPLKPNPKFDSVSFDHDVNADALWVFTSGSEGVAKIVRHSQKTLFSHCERYHAPSSCDETDRGIFLLPLYHVFGIALVLMGVFVGFSIFFPATLDLDDVIDYTLEKKITYIDHVPSFHYVLGKRAKERGITFTTLRNGLSGGAPMEESRFREIEESLNMKLLPVYGASEIIGIAALGQEASEYRRRTAVGQPLKDTILRLIDENGEEVKRGEPGEILVKSPSLMLGYLGKDTGIDEEGFFATGDIGYIDEIGDLHITGRKKQIIIRNGNNLSAADIEKRLLHLGGVINCCVVGIKDEAAGEAPAAMVALDKGNAQEAFIEAMHKELPKIMWPTKMEFVENLPTLPSGKVDRVRIKSILAGK